MNAVVSEHLSWDSAFFGFPVGRIVLPGCGADPEAMKRAICRSNESLIYVFLPVGENVAREVEKLRSVLVGLRGRCYDLKLTYRKSIEANNGEAHTEGRIATQVTPALESLAYASGWCSRFVTDERLAKFFKPMYLAWLRRDLENGCVFMRPNAEAPEGMITASVQNGIGKIGLVAVDANHCRKGIGMALLRDADRWFSGQGVCTCEVITQGLNVAARHLYEKYGFKLHSQVEVWHIWKPDLENT